MVLDPGHGGIDTGTKGPGGEIMEKNIVLDFAGRLRERIEKTGKYRVLMTRTDDTFIPLGERVHMARNAGAALFVSIHADSLPKKEGDAQGATAFFRPGSQQNHTRAEEHREDGSHLALREDPHYGPHADVPGVRTADDVWIVVGPVWLAERNDVHQDDPNGARVGRCAAAEPTDALQLFPEHD